MFSTGMDSFKSHFQANSQPYVDIYRDRNGNPIEDPNNAYLTREIENVSRTVLPSIGLTVDF
jgi:hypothetical protein